MKLTFPLPTTSTTTNDLYINGWRITQHFDEHPENYIKFGLPGHEGIDFGVREGTPLLACYAAVVSVADPNPAGAYGEEVRLIWEADGAHWEAIYAHCSKVAVKQGQLVTAGETIALSGNTGNSTGAHLHFSLKQTGAKTPSRWGGIYPNGLVDPEPYLRPIPFEGASRYQVVAASGLRVRREPGGAVLCTLPKGASVWLLDDVSGGNGQYVWRKLAGDTLAPQRVNGQDISGAWLAEGEGPKSLLNVRYVEKR